MRKVLVGTLFMVFAGVCSAADEKAIAVEAVRAVDHVGSDRYALVVGIDDYQDADVPDLSTCEADARAMYNLLTDPARGGIDKKNAYLLLGRQATSRNVRIDLGKLRKIPSKSTVFIYFSGHGAKEGDEAYWVAYDSTMEDLFSTGISNMELRRCFSNIPSDRVVVMLDCCYAAAIVKGGKAAVGDFDNVLKQFTGKGRAYLMAAGSGQEAIEAQDLKQSVFTHYLIEGLGGRADGNADGVIVLTELTEYIDSHVADEARIRGGIQRPVVQMEGVSEPSKFGLTVNPEGLLEAREIQEKREKQIKADIAVLQGFYFNQKITRPQCQMGERLIRKEDKSLTPADRRIKAEYLRMIAGEFPPEKLQMALDLAKEPPAPSVPAAKPRAHRPENANPDSVDRIIDKKLNESLGKAESILEQMKELLKDEK